MHTDSSQPPAGATRRILTAAAAALLATVGLSAVAAPPAHAAEVLNCAMAGTATFDPGLGLTASSQDVGGSISIGNQVSQATPCSSPTGVPFVGGVGTINGDGTLGCTAVNEVVGTAEGTAHLTWYDHDQHVAGNSIVEWSVVFVSGFVPIVTTEVTSGDLDGAIITAQPVPTGFNGNCVLDPLVAGSFTAQAQILQP